MKTGWVRKSGLGTVLLIVGMAHTAAATGQDDRQEPPSDTAQVIRKSPEALRSDAEKRVEPEYPPLARAGKVGGSVAVEVTIDAQGNVTAARAVSGHPLLKGAAVQAARQWRFKPTEPSGRKVQVVGNIIFNFVSEGEVTNASEAAKKAKPPTTEHPRSESVCCAHGCRLSA